MLFCPNIQIMDCFGYIIKGCWEFSKFWVFLLFFISLRWGAFLRHPYLLKPKSADMDTTQIVQLVKETFSNLILVEVECIEAHKQLYVTIDTAEGVTLKECSAVTQFLRDMVALDEYTIIVSSPGADAPLRLPQQYKRNKGRTLQVKTKDGKQIEGILKEVEEDKIQIQTFKRYRHLKRPDKLFIIALDNVLEAKVKL